MRPARVLVKLFLLSALPAAAQGPEQQAQAGRRFAAGCIRCHQAPDLNFATDRAWLDQINRTAWMSEPAEARAALIAYLKSGERKAPAALTAPPAGDAGAAGIITASFEEGSLLLQSAKGVHYRAAWRKDEKPADRRRALPAGEYTLTGYRIVRRDESQEEWFISATSPKLRKLTIRAGQEQKIEVPDVIQVNLRTRVAPGGIEIQAGIMGEPCVGMSVYRGGRRIDLVYRVSGPAGTEIASGKMDYGWGGGARASCKPAAALERGASVSLDFGKPPFTFKGALSAKLTD